MNSSSSPPASQPPPRQQNNPDAAKQVHALSCVHCRQRKVRCSKTYPCPHCVRGGLECVFPSRKKDRAPRRVPNHELLNRLAKLEAIVGQVGTKAPAAEPPPPPPAGGGGPSRPGANTAGTQHSASSPVTAAVAAVEAASHNVAVHPAIASAAAHHHQHHHHQGLQPELTDPQEKRFPPAQPVSRDDPAARYVSGEFWANLSSEVEGIKAALEQPSSDDEDGHDEDETSPESAAPAALGSQGSSPKYHHHHQPHYYGTSPAIFGNPTAATARPGGGEEEGLVHPAPERARRLCETYFCSVDPLIKILHRPTVEGALTRFLTGSPPAESPRGGSCSSSCSRTAEEEALFFAMYFAAVTSMLPGRCRVLLGEDRGVLVVRYRRAVECALARADYLNSTSLETLQALTLYSTCLRNHAESRASWAMLALVLRLGQAIGIHRDGDGLAYPPYEAEMRRRLWSQMVVLDVRAASDRGSEPMVRQDEYNTLPPTNIDDAGFGPRTAVPVPTLAREGTTDVTFCLCTYECSSLFLHIHGPRSRFSKAGQHDAGTAVTSSSSSSSNSTAAPKSLVQPQVSEEDLVQRIKKLEAQFTPSPPSSSSHQEPAHLRFQSALATSVIRIASLTYWLSVQYPFQVRQPVAKPRVSREHMLQTAVCILELKSLGPTATATSSTTNTNSNPSSASSASSPASRGGLDPAEYRERFSWWGDGYTQWHALAVALAELCVQTEGALVRRAWGVVDGVAGDLGDKVADSRGGALWRPIRKLLRKARERRAEALARGARGAGGGGGGGGGSVAAAGREGPAGAQVHGLRQWYRGQPLTGLAVASHSPPPPPPPQSTSTITQTASENPNLAGATSIRPPSNPATEAGPTGIPPAQDLPGELPDMGSTTWAAASAADPPLASATATTSTTTTATTMTTPPAIILANDHIHNWGAIDFGDLRAVPAVDVLMGGAGGPHDLDMMDWSHWNEFVNDASVSFDDNKTSSSSEGVQ